MTSRADTRETAPEARFRYPSVTVVAFLRYAIVLVSKALWFIRYEGRENIPFDGEGLVVVSNHPTYFDPVWIAIPIKRGLRFMAWDEAFGWPVLGRMIRYLGAFPVKTHNGVTKSAVVESLRSLRNGAALVIFPEGERECADGRLREFKTGALLIALKSRVPILPVSVSGGNRVWPQGWKFPRIFRPIVITYHPPMQIPEKPEDVEMDDHLEAVNNELVRIIGSAAGPNALPAA